MRYLVFSLITVILAVLLCSCGGSGSPVDPTPIQTDTQAQTLDSGNRTLWGIWDVIIDPDTQTIEVVPIRGANFECNVVNFLQPPVAPMNLLSFEIDPSGTNFPAGQVACYVTIKHPFPGTQFCGFDVLGIVMGTWQGYELGSDPAIIVSYPPNTVLQNPDGYTRWWNNPEFSTYGTLFGYIEGKLAVPNWYCERTLNGFKYFADDLEPDEVFEPDPHARGFFSSSMPGINTRRYELQFPGFGGVDFRFKYAISASWEPPFEYAEPPFVAEDYPLTANMPEPYKIDMIDNGSTAYFKDMSDRGGDLNLFIEIRDWQFDGTISGVADEFHAVIVESFSLFPDPISLDLNLAELVPGNSTAIRIPAVIEDVTPNSVEKQILVVTAQSKHPDTYEPQIPGISGFDYPEGHLAAYYIMVVPIKSEGPENEPPVANASASNPLSGAPPLTVDLDPSLSYDPDGVIVLYEWDFETDGVYDISTTAPDVIPYEFPAGTHFVTLRVTDDDDASDTDQITITAGEETGWPMFHRNLRRTGRHSVSGPITNNVEWSIPLTYGGEVHSGFSIDSTGRIFLYANDGYLYCIEPDGDIAWEYFISAGSWNYCTPSVGSDDSVYVGDEAGNLVHVDSDGNLIWTEFYPYGYISSGLAVQSDGSVLFTTWDGYLVKVDSDGGFLWAYSTYTMPVPGSPAIHEDGTIYISSHGDYVCAVDQDGNEIWKTDCGSSNMNAVPVLGDEYMYVGSWSSTFYCLDYDGNIEWSTPTTGDIHSVAVIGWDGDVYCSDASGNVYRFDGLTGDIEWTFPTSGGINASSPVMDGEGRIYIGNWNGDVYCITSDGDQVWTYDTGDAGIHSLSSAISDEGSVYFATGDGIMYAFHD